MKDSKRLTAVRIAAALGAALLIALVAGTTIGYTRESSRIRNEAYTCQGGEP